MEPTLRVEGLNELVRSVRKVQAKYPLELKAINLQVAEPIAKVAKRYVATGPTGRLGNSIRPGATQRISYVAAGSRLKYGGVNHFGWPRKNITGNPFLTDAIWDEQERTLDVYLRETDKFIDEVWESIP